MSVLQKKEFFDKVKAIIGESDTDEALSFLEDVTDTFNDMEVKSNGGSGENWEQKYKDLDASWKKRYRERFFKGEESQGTDMYKPNDDSLGDDENSDDENVPQKFDELFTEKEG